MAEMAHGKSTSNIYLQGADADVARSRRRSQQHADEHTVLSSWLACTSHVWSKRKRELYDHNYTRNKEKENIMTLRVI